MGIYDREYYRNPLPRAGFASMRMWSVTTWLIIINVAVFLLDQLLKPNLQANLQANPRLLFEWLNTPDRLKFLLTMGPLEKWGHFSLTLGIANLQVWRFLTFQFLHASIGHLFGNMLSLYLFGQIVEAYFGPRRFLAFYLLCGAAGAVSYLVLWMFGFLVTSPMVPLVGASAGVFGVLIATALIAPDMEIFLLFPPMPVQVRVLAWFMIGIAAYTVFTHGHNAGGEAAHLGGAFLGFAIMKSPHWLNPFVRRTNRRWFNPKLARPKEDPGHDWTNDLNR